MKGKGLSEDEVALRIGCNMKERKKQYRRSCLSKINGMV